MTGQRAVLLALLLALAACGQKGSLYFAETATNAPATAATTDDKDEDATSPQDP